MFFQIVLVLALGLMPLLLSLILLRKMKQRWQARLRRIHSITAFRQRSPDRESSREDSFELQDYFIGDLSCRYNARSPYIRCAVNPDGPCEGCRFYQGREGS